MKPFSENELIAYHLHELSPRRARALEEAIQSDPLLAAECAAYAAVLHSFKSDVPLDVDEETMDRNWSRIWSKLPVAPLRPAMLSRWLVPAMAGFAFAATAFVVFTRNTHGPVHKPSTASSDSKVRHATPSFSDSPAAHAGQGDPNMERGYSQPSRVRFTLSPAAALIGHLHDAPPRMLPVVPKGEEASPMLQYIPLARMPFPLPPAQDSPVPANNAEQQQITFGPDHASKLKQPHKVNHRDRYMEVTVAMGGTFIGTRDVNETHTQGATHAVNAIGSFHQQFRPAIGYRFTASYTRPDFQYVERPNSNSSGSQTDVVGRVYSFAGTYVVQGPHRGVVSTTVEGGTALMAFLPVADAYGITRGANLRVAGVVAVGAEVAVTKHLAINTGYRVQIFKGPDFRSSNAGLPQIATTLISNEPSVGISYRFAQK